MLLGYGDAGAGVWMFYLAILLHGVCFDFFFVTGQLYTDQEAPAHLRSTAQGFITVVTYGFGMLVGSLLSGYALDYFSTTTGDGDRPQLAVVLAQLGGDVGRDRAAGAAVLQVEGDDPAARSWGWLGTAASDDGDIAKHDEAHEEPRRFSWS